MQNKYAQDVWNGALHSTVFRNFSDKYSPRPPPPKKGLYLCIRCLQNHYHMSPPPPPLKKISIVPLGLNAQGFFRQGDKAWPHQPPSLKWREGSSVERRLHSICTKLPPPERQLKMFVLFEILQWVTWCHLHLFWFLEQGYKRHRLHPVLFWLTSLGMECCNSLLSRLLLQCWHLFWASHTCCQPLKQWLTQK